MTRALIASLATLSLGVAGCQKATMKAAPQPSPSPNFALRPPPGGAPVFTPPPPPPGGGGGVVVVVSPNPGQTLPPPDQMPPDQNPPGTTFPGGTPTGSDTPANNPTPGQPGGNNPGGNNPGGNNPGGNNPGGNNPGGNNPGGNNPGGNNPGGNNPGGNNPGGNNPGGNNPGGSTPRPGRPGSGVITQPGGSTQPSRPPGRPGSGVITQPGGSTLPPGPPGPATNVPIPGSNRPTPPPVTTRPIQPLPPGGTSIVRPPTIPTASLPTLPQLNPVPTAPPAPARPPTFSTLPPGGQYAPPTGGAGFQLPRPAGVTRFAQLPAPISTAGLQVPAAGAAVERIADRLTGASPAPAATTTQIAQAPLPPSRPASLGGTSTKPPVAEFSSATDGPSRQPVAGQCQPGKVNVTQKETAQKISILFVVDTSASLVKGPKGRREGGELHAIARGIPEFVKELPTKDYRIGVMLAHGPVKPVFGSKGNVIREEASPHFGTLFTAGDLPVIDPIHQNLTTEQVVARLEKKMLSVPDDKSDAQGEALLMGLTELLENPTKKKQANTDKLFVPGRDLIVVLITDEQDVCFDYTGTGFSPVLKPYYDRGSKISWEADRHELKFYSQYCQTWAKKQYGQPIGYKTVAGALDKLHKKLNANVVVEAIAYTSPQPQYSMMEDDNEMGHGVIDLVRETGGDPATGVADLGLVDRNSNTMSFSGLLSQLGQHAAFQLHYATKFPCQSEQISAKTAAKATVKLEILDDQGRHFKTYTTACGSTSCQHGDGGLSIHEDGAGFSVQPKNLSAYTRDMKAAGFAQPQYRITFESK